MMDFHCNDTGMKCSWVGRGNSETEVIAQARDHATKVHELSLTPELEQKLRSLVHDEASEAHRQSMAKR